MSKMPEFARLRQMSRYLSRIFSKFYPLFILLWILLVLYPNPLNLAITIQRRISYDIDPAAVETLAEDLPSDPVAIESAVLELVPYSYDWEVHNMPWYIPTVEEVLEDGRGDCEARAVVLASILESRDIPYQLNWSTTHVWVEYEGKEETSYENSDVGFYQQDPETGERVLHIPHISIGEVWTSFREGFWSPMPVARRVLLIFGPVMLITIRLIMFKKRKTI